MNISEYVRHRVGLPIAVDFPRPWAASGVRAECSVDSSGVEGNLGDAVGYFLFGKQQNLDFKCYLC